MSTGAHRQPRPDWRTDAKWRFVDLVTWPWQARQLKRAGFVRKGWKHWEYPG